MAVQDANGIVARGLNKGVSMKLLIAASLALALAAAPASAAVPVPVMKVMGADFYTRCTNPPADKGAQIVTVCAAYVAGIADDLKDAGQVCLAPGVTPAQLLPFALNWIRLHMQNGSYPAALQIRTGLSVAFPCRPTTRTVQKQQMTLGDAVALGKQFLAFWSAAKPIVALLLQ